MSNQENLINILEGVQSSSTITALAESLFLSQPYLSRIIKNAEQKYGIQLVDRTSKPISLTEAGKVVLANLRRIRESELHLQNNLDNLR